MNVQFAKLNSLSKFPLLSPTFSLSFLQILRGNLKEVVSNINNSSKSKIDIDLKPKQIVKPTFVPIKNKIQLMEKDQEKSKIETEEFMQKHKTIMAHKIIENFDDEPKISEETEMEKNGNGHQDSNGHEDAVVELKNGKPSDTPPKPLPRKSISDQGSFDENSSIVPKPRPRTACPALSYKVFYFSTHALRFSYSILAHIHLFSRFFCLVSCLMCGSLR